MASRTLLSGINLIKSPNLSRWMVTKSSSLNAGPVYQAGLPTCEVTQDHKPNVCEETHTGQVWDQNDYRNVRFKNATRHVNPNWGIKLINEIPPKECTERVVWCDGGDAHLGHPKVYINLDKPGDHICGYCGLRFVKKDHH